jgi:hypothetical protein
MEKKKSQKTTLGGMNFEEEDRLMKSPSKKPDLEDSKGKSSDEKAEEPSLVQYGPGIATFITM